MKIELFFIDFSKGVLFLIFLYSLFSYLAFSLWRLELDDVIYHSKYTNGQLYLENIVKGSTTLVDEKKKKQWCQSTNWGENSCYA